MCLSDWSSDVCSSDLRRIQKKTCHVIRCAWLAAGATGGESCSGGCPKGCTEGGLPIAKAVDAARGVVHFLEQIVPQTFQGGAPLDVVVAGGFGPRIYQVDVHFRTVPRHTE